MLLLREQQHGEEYPRAATAARTATTALPEANHVKSGIAVPNDMSSLSILVKNLNPPSPSRRRRHRRRSCSSRSFNLYGVTHCV